MNLQNLNCSACGRNSDFTQHHSLKIKICTSCNAWIAINYELDDLEEIYNENYFEGGEYLNYSLGISVHNKNFLRKLRIIEEFIDLKDRNVIEIGSATGAFLSFARKYGLSNLMGVEVSRYGLDKCKEEKLSVYSPFDPDLNNIVNIFRPNILIAWDVWEHLSNPSEIFKGYLDLLPKNSIVALTTVDSSSLNARFRQTNWRQFHPPTHLVYPTRKSFQLYFKDLGFEVVYHSSFGYFRPLSEYLSALFGRIKFISDSKFLCKIPIYLNLYDTQLVIARKI